jgi:hypothetical protein
MQSCLLVFTCACAMESDLQLCHILSHTHVSTSMYIYAHMHLSFTVFRSHVILPIRFIPLYVNTYASPFLSPFHSRVGFLMLALVTSQLKSLMKGSIVCKVTFSLFTNE